MMKRLWPGLIIGLLLAGCAQQTGRVDKEVAGGDPALGAELIEAYGCGACHQIGGIADAEAMVGPPLIDFEQRHYIAGALPNEAENLAYWVHNPQLVEHGTAMPDLGVTEEEAWHIAAYLYSDRNSEGWFNL